MKRPPILDYIRHALAVVVIFSHSFAFGASSDPRLFGITPGTLAVYGFFFISGSLVLQSWRRNRIQFASRRFARLAPAWITAIALGWLLSTPNASLWSLPWECFCYAVIVFSRGRAWLLIPAGMLLIALGAPPLVPTMFCAFGLGALCRLESSRLPFDYSYGLYVYAFPIQATLAGWLHPSALMLFFFSLAATLPLAALSWHAIEAPALRYLRNNAAARHVDKHAVHPIAAAIAHDQS